MTLAWIAQNLRMALRLSSELPQEQQSLKLCDYADRPRFRLAFFIATASPVASAPAILDPSAYRGQSKPSTKRHRAHHQRRANAKAWGLDEGNIPWFDCSDKEIQDYYFSGGPFESISADTIGFVSPSFSRPCLGRQVQHIACAATPH